jgi:hypothetical protein
MENLMVTLVDEIEKAESKDAAPVVEWAKALVVNTVEEYTQAVKAMAECTRRARAVKDKLEKNRKETHAAYQGVLDLIKQLSERWLMAEAILRPKAAQWKTKEDNRIREEQRIADEAAQKEADEKKLREAVALEDNHFSPELVNRVLSAPVVAIAKPVERKPDPAKEEGVSWREAWGVGMVDMHLLIKAAALDESLESYLLPNMPNLNAQARKQKGALAIPGATPVMERVSVVKGRE